MSDLTLPPKDTAAVLAIWRAMGKKKPPSRVTPEMIAAGVEAVLYLEYVEYPLSSPQEVVRQILEAALAVSCETPSTPSPTRKRTAMRAELFVANSTDARGFVAAFDMPPFLQPPENVVWGSRTFARVEGLTTRFGAKHTTECPHDKVTVPALTCGCGGVFAYQEVTCYPLSDPQQVPAKGYVPVTRKA